MQEELAITPLETKDIAAFDAHFARHRAESGRGDIHFMPFAPDDPDGPNGLDSRRLQVELDKPGWQRWWVAWDVDDEAERVIGHVDLKGPGLRAAGHRCELGIGIERNYRGNGLGKALMLTAIRFVRETPGLDYIDLRVFSHNTVARALYRQLGFVETGVVTDLVRIGATSLDDVMMVLDLRPTSGKSGPR